MKIKNLLSKILLSITFIIAFAFTSNTLLAQVKIGSNPAVIAPNNNLEVEALNGNVFRINKDNGEVRIQDGSQGAGKVFTSNANGVGTWRDLKTKVSYGTAGDPPVITGGTTILSDDFKYSNMSITIPAGKWLIFLNATYKNELDGPCNAYWDLSETITSNSNKMRVVGASGPVGNYLPISAMYNVEVTSTTTYYFFVGFPGSVSGRAVYSGEKRVFAIPIE